MDEERVDIQVLLPLPVTLSYCSEPELAEEMSKFQNDFIADTVKQYPDCFIGLGTAPSKMVMFLFVKWTAVYTNSV